MLERLIIWKTKTSISFRVEDFTLYCIDKLSEELDGSRAGTVLEIVSEGVLMVWRLLDTR